MDSLDSAINTLVETRMLATSRGCRDAEAWNSLCTVLNHTARSMRALLDEPRPFSRKQVYQRHSPLYNCWDKSRTFRVLPPVPASSAPPPPAPPVPLIDLPLLEQLANLHRLNSGVGHAAGEEAPPAAAPARPEAPADHGGVRTFL